MTNEYEEIVQQLLLPSKSLTYLKHSLDKMREAYLDYGHDMPIVFFTDNVKSDKTFLESVFESLKDDVKPVHVDEMNGVEASVGDLKLPENVKTLYICRNFELMDNEIMNLLQEIRNDNSASEEETVVGFDCEWNAFSAVSKVDVIQICYKDSVFVLHVDRSWHTLPRSLLSLLENQSIKKVGRQVGGDLSRISRSFNEVCCRGKLELGSFCSTRKCIPNGNILYLICLVVYLGAEYRKMNV
jgi:hypothetical protein